MKTRFSVTTATALVIANMVGTGVFTSLGFQVGRDAAGNPVLSSGLALILLWILGGAIALFGALTYSEAGVLYPRCGGEYHYLTKMYHPAVGFLSGWISFLVGFAAPVAAASIALGNYLSSALALPERLAGGLSFVKTPSLFAIGVIIVLTAIHAADKMLGARFQNLITLFKVLCIFGMVGLGLVLGRSAHLSFGWTRAAGHDILSPAFAISMFFVSFAYSGWNAAAYIAGEMENPAKNLPRSLITGTLFVIVLYVLLNFAFLYTVPLPELAGKLEVGFIFAAKVFGTKGGQIMAGVISFLLLSSISAMIIAGPRVTRVIGEDYHLFRWMGRTTRKDIPAVAIITQGLLSVFYILTSTFDQVIVFIGFTLNLFTFMTVLGVMILRKKHPELPRPYKTLGYPVVPALFLLINTWILVYGLLYRPKESLAGIGITAAGFIVYAVDKRVRPKDDRPAGDASCVRDDA
jgi:APA family basic amino acid/polyamine antiporter